MDWSGTIYLVSVGTQGDTEGSGKTKIGQLEVTLLVDEQVLRLQITVQDSVGVAVANSLAKLGHEFLNHAFTQAHVTSPSIHDTFRQWLSSSTLRHGQGLHVFLQVEIQILEDQIQLVTVGVDDVQQADNVWVVHLLEQRNLTDGSRRDTLIFGFQTDLLEGDNAVVGGGQITGFVDNSVRAWGGGLLMDCALHKEQTAAYPLRSFPSSDSSPFSRAILLCDRWEGWMERLVAQRNRPLEGAFGQ